jgi:hypothetical protein
MVIKYYKKLTIGDNRFSLTKKNLYNINYRSLNKFMNCNKKDLYQILRINKNISDQEINSLALVKASKDDTEANKALLVLSDPNKRREYDRIG